MTLRPGDWVILLLFGGLVFFYFRGVDLAPAEDSPGEGISGENMLLFVLDFRDFSCMTCLDSFLWLYQKLPFRFRTSGSWGIMVMEGPDKEEEVRLGIAEKKLRGFLQANHITFPVLLDRTRVLGGLAEKGSAVILFDRKTGRVTKYSFPLTGEQIEEIFITLQE